MQRRNFLYTGMIALSTTFMSAPIKASSSKVIMPQKNLVVCFRAGSVESPLIGDAWAVCTMADPRLSQRPEVIRLLLQVSSDEDFNDIVFEEKHLALKTNFYIVRAVFKHPPQHDALFYRFKAIDIPRIFSRGASVNGEEVGMSKTKKLVKSA